MDHSISSFLLFLQQLPGDLISLMVLVIAIALLVIAWKSLGIFGLYTYQVVILLAANIQVLRLGTTIFSPEPIALGTIIFSTIYIADDLLNLHFGIAAARRGIWIGFLAQLIFTIMMLTVLAYAPLQDQQTYEAMALLFVPSMRIMVASLCAYCTSQLLNVYLFAYWRARWPRSLLWASVCITASLATFIDHFVFSFCAWKLFADPPVSWHTLWMSYLMPSLLPRLLIALVMSPLVSASRCIRSPAYAV